MQIGAIIIRTKEIGKGKDTGNKNSLLTDFIAPDESKGERTDGICDTVTSLRK